MFALFLILLIAPGVSFAVDNPVRSPVGPPTVPPSSMRRNLIPRPQENFGTDGNLIITGNVSGGKHFRGIVPYRSATEFGDELGSDSLNSFIRRSAGAPYIDKKPSQIQPYYLPSQTVTSMKRHGQDGLLPPKIAGIETAAVPLPPLPGEDINTSYGKERPWSMDKNELERLIDLQLELIKLRETEAEDPYGLETDATKTELEKLDLIEELQLEKDVPDEPEKPAEIEQAIDIEAPEQQEDMKEADLLLEELEEAELEKTDTTELEQDNKYKPKLPEKKELPEPDHKKAKEILGSHKDFKSLAQAKFKKYIEAANNFLRQGEYYKAADAYILAGVWGRKHPLPLIGRAHALFAAGEYMSSAYFLGRAITLEPRYASKSFNLPKLLFDRDMIENRLIELMTWQQKTESGELAFLLSYILFQTDNLAVAQKMINLAIDKMPDNPAVNYLKKAVDAANNK